MLTTYKDPFDLLLTSKAIEELLTSVSVDPMMVRYPVAVLG
jgi:PIN domain nuclease of toxin-antitoxin system